MPIRSLLTMMPQTTISARHMTLDQFSTSWDTTPSDPPQQVSHFVRITNFLTLEIYPDAFETMLV